MELIYQVLNIVTDQVTRGELEKEVQSAHEEYFARTGSVFEDNPGFENRMSLFLEWYAFNRKLPSRGITPFECLMEDQIIQFNEEEMRVVESLRHHLHSVFEFQKAKGNLFVIVDLATGKKLKVFDRRGTQGFLKGSIFEARVITVEKQEDKKGEESNFFSGPMLFHPHETKKFIKKYFKESEKDHLDMILDLAAMRHKSEQYRHVEPKNIYSLNPSTSIKSEVENNA